MLAVGLTVAGTLPASSAGALVVGFIPDGRFVWAARDRTDLPAGATAAQIEAAALAECKRTAAASKVSGDKCKVTLRYDDQCFGLAASTPSGHRGGWAVGAEKADAEKQALEMCRGNARGSGESCKLLSSFCDR
jgi:hypothetical protein